jgi:hypothetical protein
MEGDMVEAYGREVALFVVTFAVYIVVVFSDRASYARLVRDLERLDQLGAAKVPPAGITPLHDTTAYKSAKSVIEDLRQKGPIHRRSAQNYFLMLLLGFVAAGLAGFFAFILHKSTYYCPRFFFGGLPLYPYDCPIIRDDVWAYSLPHGKMPGEMLAMVKYQISTLYAVGTALFMSLYTMLRQIYLLVQQYRFDGMTALRYILYLFSSVGLSAIFWMFLGSTIEGLSSPVNTIALPIAIGMVAAIIPDEVIQGILQWMRRRGAIQSPKALTTEDELPKALPLTLIDGITETVGDTLRHFGIEDCHQLALGNPLYIYCISPYSLPQVISWIAQAQLIVMLRPDKAATLRRSGILSAFGFMGYSPPDSGVSFPATDATLAGLLQMTADQVRILQAQMASWHPYRQLKEVCDAL